MKQIIVIGDNSSTNLGDPILTRSTYYIVKKIVAEDDYEVSIFDIAGRIISSQTRNIFGGFMQFSEEISKSKIFLNNVLNDLKSIVGWFKSGKRDFLNRLQGNNIQNGVLFIIAGGALISSSLFYAFRINAIIQIAKYYNGRVVFNAVGIEKSIRNFGLAKYIVRHYLRQPEVIAFSTRDHVEDVPFITKNKKFAIQIPDPALFAAEAFSVEKNESDVIGLSVISYQAYQSVIFNDRRMQIFSVEDLFSFWSNIINGFIVSGQKFKILTNGGGKDYDTATQLCRRMNLSTEEYLLPLPKEARQLVDQLSQFRIIIAHRLHALIVSTSLKIPVIPVIWSDKVRAFADMIKNEYAVWPSTDINVVELIKSITFDNNIIQKLKKQSFVYIRDAIKQSEL